jgi:hypothetical protein
LLFQQKTHRERVVSPTSPIHVKIITIDKSIPAFYETQSKEYKKEALTPENAAKIPCKQVLGSYFVVFTC